MRDLEQRHQLTCLVTQPPWAGARSAPSPTTTMPPASMRNYPARRKPHTMIAALLLTFLGVAPVFSGGLHSPADTVALRHDQISVVATAAAVETPADRTKTNVPRAPRPPDGSASSLNTQGAPPELDLDTLEERLRATDAVGFFTKLQLRNEINELLDAFRAYHRGQGNATREELWEDYYLLLFKIITLLQDGDPELAQEIYGAREALWEVLLNPQTFEQS